MNWKDVALLPIVLPATAVDYLLSGSRTYRRMWGGHWEQWGVREPVHGTVWLRMERCHHSPGAVREFMLVGVPRCEDYRYREDRPCDDYHIGPGDHCRTCDWPMGLHP